MNRPHGAVLRVRVAAGAAACTCALILVGTLVSWVPAARPAVDLGVRSTAEGPTAEPTSSPEPPEREPADPVRLTLPTLGVDAAVHAVGTGPDGAMTVPADTGAVGWFAAGPAPASEAGSAVIAGHVDTAAGELGAFANLGKVAVGTPILVTDANEETHRFRVVGRHTVPESELDTTDLFRTDGAAVLTLVTCTGPFTAEQGYAANLLVTAVEA